MHRHALKYTPNIMFRGLITGSQTSCLSVLAYLWVAGGDRSAPQETGQEGSKVTFSKVSFSKAEKPKGLTSTARAQVCVNAVITSSNKKGK